MVVLLLLVPLLDDKHAPQFVCVCICLAKPPSTQTQTQHLNANTNTTIRPLQQQQKQPPPNKNKQGRLLRVYGRFLEWVRNDPPTAARYYAEAVKQGTGESLLALVGGSSAGAQDGALRALGAIDEKADGIVVINAAGAITAVNRAAFELFGYGKGELEGKNVSTLMPQPFSGRHNGCARRGWVGGWG